MIKTVKKIKTIVGKYPIPLDVFEINPPLCIENEDYVPEYLTGGFYTTGYSIVALYPSSKEGEIWGDIPFIHEDGVNSYQELFKRYGYTLI